MNKTNLYQRFQTIHQYLCAGLQEREETMSVALLSVLAGQSVFLFGPPGTAKSLMARRLSCAFKESKHFEYLMQKFSTPEEIFGPIDITQLKQGNYVRKTKGYLPTADFAFLDEIWKSNPAILNTLLTITNERIFRNGDSEDKTPLKALIGASNELPQSGLGLEALWDRFVVRLEVPPLQDKHNFEALLDNPSVEAKIDIPPELAFSIGEWKRMIFFIDKVKISKQVKYFIFSIKEKVDNEKDYYISDCHWLQSIKLIKSSAFFSGRIETNLQDALLLRHCLWNGVIQQSKIEEWLNIGIIAAYRKTMELIDLNIDSAYNLTKHPQNFKYAGESKEKYNYLQTIATLLEAKICIFSHENTIKLLEKEKLGDCENGFVLYNIKILKNKLNDIDHRLDMTQRLFRIDHWLEIQDIYDDFIGFLFGHSKLEDMGDHAKKLLELLKKLELNTDIKLILDLLNEWKLEMHKDISKIHGGKTATNLLIHNNQTVTDPKTGLMWKRKCESKNYTYDESIARFKGKDIFVEYHDWRLPTIDELKTILLPNLPYIDKEAFPDNPSMLLSNSPYEDDISGACIIYFGQGQSYISRSRYYGVRLVRKVHLPNPSFIPF